MTSNIEKMKWSLSQYDDGKPRPLPVECREGVVEVVSDFNELPSPSEPLVGEEAS